MKLSSVIENALRNFLVGISGCHDQNYEAQERLIKELDKGKDRDLRNVMDVIIEVGEKSRVHILNLTDLWNNPEIKENEEELRCLVAAVRASNTGDFSELEDLPEDLAELIKNNLKVNRELNRRIEDPHGKDAMTRALNEDGLIEEFQDRMRAVAFSSLA